MATTPQLRQIENVPAIPMAQYDAIIDVLKAGPKK